MKHKLHKLMAMLVAAIFAVSAFAQTDVTSQYLVNADFETASPQNGGAINTPPGWTLKHETSGWLDGSTRASTNPGGDGSQCYNLWAGTVSLADIYQTVTLPAGKYKLTVGLYSDGEAERYAYATVGGNTIKSANAKVGSWDFVSVEFSNPTEGEVTMGAVSKGWFQIDNVTLEYLGEVTKDDFINAYNQALSEAQALVGQKMSAVAAAQLEATIAAYGSLTADNSIEELEAATEAILAEIEPVKASVNSYKVLAAGVLPDNSLAGWTCTNGNTFHINTWSGEGSSDGTNMVTPFIENWIGKESVLGNGKISYTLPGVNPGYYKVSSLIRVYSEANNDITGASFFANEVKTDFATGKPFTYNNMKGIYDVYTAVVNVGEEGTLEFGVEIENATFNWVSFKNVKIEYIGVIDQAAAEALKAKIPTTKYDAALTAEVEALVAAIDAGVTFENYLALSEKVALAETSAAAYAANKTAIDGMFSLMESTNVYTAEAFAAYSAKAEDFLAQYEAGTLTATVDNPLSIHGWHATVEYDDFMLSAFGVKDFDDALHINTWSNEGETDGSEFKVPFFEYWVGDGDRLAPATKTATVTGLVPGAAYNVEAWIRTRATNGVAGADATGITLSVGEGEAVDVTEGAVIGGGQFAHAVYTATGNADAEGNLVINFNILDGNNISWLAFKNLKYTAIVEEEPEEPVVAPTLDGTYFSIGTAATTLEVEKWYLLKNQGRNAYISEQTTEFRMKNAGELSTANSSDANKGLLFKLVKGEADGQYSIVSGNGLYLSFVQDGSTPSESPVDYIIGSIADGVWYMQDPVSKVVADGNAAGGTFVGWGSSVPTSTGGNNAYEFLEAAIFDEATMETLDKAANFAYDLQVTYGLVSDASQFSSNAPETQEGSFGALIDGEYTTFFHSAWSYEVEGAHHLQVEVSEPVESFSFYFKKRSQNNANRPTDITILGSNDGNDFVEIATINSGLPTSTSDIEYASEVITAQEAYKHFRFVVNSTSTNSKFFTFSEFYLLPADKAEALAAAQAVVAAGPVAENFDELAEKFELVYANVQTDKFNKLFVAAVAEAEALLAAATHAEVPAIGQYTTASYEKFQATIDVLKAEATQENLEAINAAIVDFNAAKNRPVFTIDSQKDYAAGQSIYENENGSLNFKATDTEDKTMLWAFDMTATEVGLTDKVVVSNVATGNLFWGAKFIAVIETEPAVEGDGVFMFKTEGTGSPVHAQQNGSAIVRWSSADANCVGGASTWKFTYVGDTYSLMDLEPEELSIVSATAGDVAIVEGKATVESISSFEITFNRPVALAEDAEWAQLTDQWGDNPLKAEVLADNNCVVRFALQWEQVFTDAGDYYLYIPEGVVVDAENANCVNAAIEAVITIEGGSVEPATPLAVVNVTVGEDVMSDLSAISATPADMIKVNFDGKFYFQGEPTIVDENGDDASMAFEFMNGLDVDGSNSYIFMGKKAGVYTITLAKDQFNELEMMGWKAPAEDIVLKVQIIVENDPTGIESVESQNEAVIYDLSGRRVQTMTKGLYIVNGRKVIVK